MATVCPCEWRAVMQWWPEDVGRRFAVTSRRRDGHTGNWANKKAPQKQIENYRDLVVYSFKCWHHGCLHVSPGGVSEARQGWLQRQLGQCEP